MTFFPAITRHNRISYSFYNMQETAETVVKKLQEAQEVRIKF